MPEMTSQETWYLVVNASLARIFARPDLSSPSRLIWEEEYPAGRLQAREIDSDRPGRTFDRLGPTRNGQRQDNSGYGRSAMEREQSPEEHHAACLAKQLAELLDHGRTAGSFGRLVLVAEPSMLGLIRANLSSQTATMVDETIRKNLAHHPEAELQRRLDELDGVIHGAHPPRHLPRGQQEKP